MKTLEAPPAFDDWTYECRCGCGAKLQVEPSDVRGKREQNMWRLDPGPLYFFARCPVCSDENRIPADKIPAVLRAKAKPENNPWNAKFGL